MTGFDEIRKLASLPTQTVALCLAGELLGELGELERQLADAQPATSVGEASPRRVIGEQIAELQERMRESTVLFKLRAIPVPEWVVFWTSLPVRGDGEPVDDWNGRILPFYIELVSRSCIDPVMSVDEVTELTTLLHGRAWTVLVGACIGLNSNEVSVPNFEAASDLTETSGQT